VPHILSMTDPPSRSQWFRGYRRGHASGHALQKRIAVTEEMPCPPSVPPRPPHDARRLDPGVLRQVPGARPRACPGPRLARTATPRR
jgi:hypothetical protein